MNLENKLILFTSSYSANKAVWKKCGLVRDFLKSHKVNVLLIYAIIMHQIIWTLHFIPNMKCMQSQFVPRFYFRPKISAHLEDYTMYQTQRTRHEMSVVCAHFEKLEFARRPKIRRETNKAHSPERVNKSVIITLYKWISYIWLTL